MKIVHINSLYTPYQVGGAEKSVQTLAEFQAKAGHDVSVLCLHSDSVNARKTINGVEITYIPIDNIYFPFFDQKKSLWSRLRWHMRDSFNAAARKRIRNHLETISPDVVNTHNLAGFSVSAWAAADDMSLPIVHSLRDYYLICPKSTMFDGIRRCMSQCYSCNFFSSHRKLASQKIQHVVGNSKFIIERHKNFGYFANSRSASVIYSGIEKINPYKKIKVNRKQRISYGYIGQITAAKGIPQLLEAFRLAGPHFELNIAGSVDGPFAQEMKRRSPTNVRWLGWRTPEEFFPTLDVVVIPSAWDEPQSRVAIEAAMYGVGIIGAKRGGIIELVTMFGGTLYEPGDPLALYDAIQKYAQLGLDRVTTIPSQYQEQFDARNFARAYELAYSKAIEKSL